MMRRCRILPEHNRQETEKREHTAGERKDEKLHRRMPPLFASPNADQEKQRDERELEEHVEQNDVASRENAEHAGLEQEERRVIRRRPLANRIPAYQHAREREQCGEAEQ